MKISWNTHIPNPSPYHSIHFHNFWPIGCFFSKHPILGNRGKKWKNRHRPTQPTSTWKAVMQLLAVKLSIKSLQFMNSVDPWWGFFPLKIGFTDKKVTVTNLWSYFLRGVPGTYKLSVAIGILGGPWLFSLFLESKLSDLLCLSKQGWTWALWSFKLRFIFMFSECMSTNHMTDGYFEHDYDS